MLGADDDECLRCDVALFRITIDWDHGAFFLSRSKTGYRSSADRARLRALFEKGNL